MENSNVENINAEVVEAADTADTNVENAELSNTDDSEEQGESGTGWANFKKDAAEFLNRKNHSKMENLRLAAGIAAIIFVIGIFLPLIGSTVNLSVTTPNNNNGTSEYVIFEPQNDVIKFSAGFLVFHQPLKSFKIFGTELGDMQILGLNFYDILSSPMPDYSGITKLNEGIQSGALSILTDEKFVTFCNENLGDFGKTLVELGKVINEVAYSLGDTLNKIESALDSVKTASDEIRQVILMAENTLSGIEICTAIAFAIIIIMMLLVIFRKNKIYVVPGILTFFSVVFIAIQVAVIAINAAIAGAIEEGMNSLSEAIASMLNDIVPGISNILQQLTLSDTISFMFNGKLYCGAGWWLMTIGLVAITVFSYIIVTLERKAARTDLTGPEPVKVELA